VKFDRSFWILLVAGVGVRCVALNQPLIDAHLIRQCQTAAATKSLIEEPGFHLSAKIPWLGDLDAHYVQELPLYNYLVIAVNSLVHHLDFSGKVTSILLWAASFLILQFIWRRILNPSETLWANLLFVVAPLSVFFGQAFMPEMLVQLVAFAFILVTLHYDENPTLLRWSICAGLGLFALLIKLPEVAHLYLIVAFVVIRRDGWRAIVRPRYWVAAVITVVALKAWSNYVDLVNAPFLPEWTSIGNLRAFIGPLGMRFQFKPWAMILLYVIAFIFSGPAAALAGYGIWRSLRVPQRSILGVWLVSLALFYLTWFGNGPTGQSYYNLPALGPLCAAFGIGVAALLSQIRLTTWRRAAATILIILAVAPAIALWSYLWRQDKQLMQAANWVRNNTDPNDIVLYRPAHHWAVVDYPYNPALAYYSSRRTFVWSGYTSNRYKEIAIDRSTYAIVTLPRKHPAGFFDRVNQLRGVSEWQPNPLDWLDATAFQIVAQTDDYLAFKRRQ
jgi:Dolichyl-phosphate-mannose-protein mannosyltransferase